MENNKRVMVCVTQQKSCERLISRGAELISGDADELHVIHVVKENWKYFGQLQEADALEYLFDISKQHGAFLNVQKSMDIERTLSDYAERHGMDVIVMGESNEASTQQNMIKRLQKHTSKRVKFVIVPMELQPQAVG